MTAHTTTDAALASDRQATVLRFLEVLFGDTESGELLELRYRREDGHRMGQLFESPRRLRRMASRALRLARRTDVYVGCAPRTRRHGGRDAVARAFVLWADCDGDDAVTALERFDPQPSIVIASGSGRNCHAYWRLSEPLAAAEIERGNRRVVHALGADPASADVARILRVPATYSHKHEPPVPVAALRLDVDRRVRPADVVGGLADPPRPPHTDAPPPVHRGDDRLLAIPPDVYVHRLLGVEVPRHRKVRCPSHPDRHASLHVYETAERGWYCYGRCRRGGTIYDFAGPLYFSGQSPEVLLRGERFIEVRERLMATFFPGWRGLR